MRHDLLPPRRIRSATLIGLDPRAANPPAPSGAATAAAAAPPARRQPRRSALLGWCASVAVVALMLVGHLRAKDTEPTAAGGVDPAARERAAVNAAASLAALAPPVDAAPVPPADPSPTPTDPMAASERPGQPRLNALPMPFSSIPVPPPRPPLLPRTAPAPPRPIPDLIEGEAPAWPAADPLAAMAVDGSLRRVDPALSPFEVTRTEASGARPRVELAIREAGATPIGWYEGGESLPGGWTVAGVDRDGAVDLLTPRGNPLRLVR